MGAEWSAPPGRAEVPSSLLPFTVWDKHDLEMMKKRHAVSLGGTYALQQVHFARLLAADRQTTDDAIFGAIFDTDANGLVDAFETMCAMALLSSATPAEKVDFMHSLFDFGFDGDLRLPEVTILMRTALIACSKLDGRVQVPPTEALESMCRRAFDEAGKDYEGELAKHLFESFVFKTSQITAFLQLWSGNASQVLIAEGEQWEDPDFLANQSSLYMQAGAAPPGIPPPGSVRWLRPSEVSRGHQVVLFAGDLVFGGGPIVAGQLADQWLLSAIGILTGKPHLLRGLFLPTGQEDKGRYGVRLFKEANWTNIFVDTRMPCNSLGEMLFCHGEERHELWGFVLEKAFAKAHGCYQNLMHGLNTCEALRDLTGGVAAKLQWRLCTPSTASETQQHEPPAASRPDAPPGATPAAAGAAAGTVERGGERGRTAAAAGAGGRAAERGGAARRPRHRLAGWGLRPAGTTSPPPGWVFETMRERLSDGQLLGCSRLAWLRDPWDNGEGKEDPAGHSRDDGGRSTSGTASNNVEGSLFPPSNRLMKGLCSGVSYCVLEAFESGGQRLLRLRDPWAGQTRGDEPGQYLGDWGPSSPLWAASPALASELLERTLPGMFWMSFDAFLEIFNTLFTEGSGWLQGTQVFLELGPRTGESGGSTSAKYSVDPSPGAATATVDEGGGDIAQVSITKETKYLSRPFVPGRDVSCRVALPPGQYAVVATTLDPGKPGRFWVHVKADRNFTLRPSAPRSASTAASEPAHCDISPRETGVSVGAAYNEVEEDAEGNERTANAATVGALLESVQALTEKKLEADTYRHRHPDSKELPREDGSLPGAPSPTATSATTPLEDAVPA
eukprot:jgi/Undpi1/9615/HiC_scaffold_27.g12071.m1